MSAQPTPRPWFNDYGKLGAGDDGIGEMDSKADAALIVAAVNDYDRLLAVEAAARAFLEAAQLEAMTKAPAYIAAKRALRAALARPAEEERG